MISEFVGLKSKMYSLVDVDGKENKKAIGVDKNFIKNTRYEKFVDVLFGSGVVRHRMKRIRSKLHRIGAYDVCKISLSCFDDKRYILDDDISGLVYFHKDVKSQWKM